MHINVNVCIHFALSIDCLKNINASMIFNKMLDKNYKRNFNNLNRKNYKKWNQKKIKLNKIDNFFLINVNNKQLFILLLLVLLLY